MKLAIVVVLVAAIVVAAWVLFRSPEPKQTFRVTGIGADFMRILPDDLRPEEVEEIEGLLARFEYSVRKDLMPVEDEVEIKRELTRFLDRGSITRKELNLVMAKVGYYTFRGEVPDSIGMHPLLADSLEN